MKRQRKIAEGKSLLARFLTPALRDRLELRKTGSGFRLDDVIRSGIENRDSQIGVYAPDAESYDVFGPLFDDIIEAYHRFGVDDSHRHDLDGGKLDLEHPDPGGEFIVSTRVRVGRNLAGFPFAPGITREQRERVESTVVAALEGLTGDLAGRYIPLTDMDAATRRRMVEDHFLFKQGDRFLASAGANRDWPSARGIFYAKDKRFLVWVNEEDHLRIISMDRGGDIGAVFDRLVRAVSALEEKLEFVHSERLGYLSCCPSNLGTAMRASVHVRLPILSRNVRFRRTCDDLGLSIRGVHGEHTQGEEGVHDISNKRRVGISEVEIIKLLHTGTARLIALEQHLR